MLPGKPRCEADDCYCKSQWPYRGAKEEFKVVNNAEDGRYSIFCPTGYSYHHLEQGNCDGCGKRMLGEPLTFEYIHDTIHLCVRCCDGCRYNHSGNFIEYFENHVLNGKTCAFHRLFLFSVDRVADKTLVEDAVLCQCGLVHPPDVSNSGASHFGVPQSSHSTDSSPRDLALYFFGTLGEYVEFDGKSECLKQISYLLDEFREETIPLRKVLFQFAEYKRTRLHQKRTRKGESAKSVKALAYQVIAKYIVGALEAKDEIEGDFFIDDKLLESKDLLDRDELQSLLDEHQPGQFIRWLTQNHQVE